MPLRVDQGGEGGVGGGHRGGGGTGGQVGDQVGHLALRDVSGQLPGADRDGGAGAGHQDVIDVIRQGGVELGVGDHPGHGVHIGAIAEDRGDLTCHGGQVSLAGLGGQGCGQPGHLSLSDGGPHRRQCSHVGSGERRQGGIEGRAGGEGVQGGLQAGDVGDRQRGDLRERHLLVDEVGLGRQRGDVAPGGHHHRVDLALQAGGGVGDQGGQGVVGVGAGEDLGVQGGTHGGERRGDVALRGSQSVGQPDGQLALQVGGDRLVPVGAGGDLHQQVGLDGVDGGIGGHRVSGGIHHMAVHVEQGHPQRDAHLVLQDVGQRVDDLAGTGLQGFPGDVGIGHREVVGLGLAHHPDPPHHPIEDRLGQPDSVGRDQLEGGGVGAGVDQLHGGGLQPPGEGGAPAVGGVQRQQRDLQDIGQTGGGADRRREVKGERLLDGGTHRNPHILEGTHLFSRLLDTPTL